MENCICNCQLEDWSFHAANCPIYQDGYCAFVARNPKRAKAQGRKLTAEEIELVKQKAGL